jgi:cholesterol transport system auxiliary component
MRSVRAAAALAILATLSGCGSLGGPDIAVKVYSPQVRVVPDPAWPVADWQLSVATSAANAALDSNRIAVRPTANELQTYKGAAWSDDAPRLLETAVVAAFEDSGKLDAVTRYGGGNRGEVGLVMEVRAFESVYAGATPEAVIEVQARLIDLGGDAVLARRFRQAVPVAGVEVPAVVDAFGTAMSAISKDIVGWTLTEGDRLATAEAAAAPAD